MLKILLAPDRLAHYRRPIFNLIASKYDLDIYASKKKDLSGIEVADDQDNSFQWIPIHNLFYKKVCFWKTKLVSAALFKNYDIYIFWGDAWNLSAWMSALTCKALGKKVVFWTHGLYGNESNFKLQYRTCFYKLADKILLYGEHSKSILIDHGFNESNLYVINNSLDFDIQNQVYNDILSNQLPTINGNKSLVFVGRLEANKKLDFLLEVLASINESNTFTEKISLLIIGDGSQKAYLQQLSKNLNLSEHVTFYGACYDQKKLASLIIKSDICVSPGNVGLTAMQSLVYGTPVITHDDATKQMPEYEAVKNGVSGMLYTEGSPDSLYTAINECFELIEKGIITHDTCRQVVIDSYTPDYQLSIFNKMIKDFQI